jgi:hypothetical protein
MATRLSLHYLTAALVAGLAWSLAPTAPAAADEYPIVRAPRVYSPPPRVRTVTRVRTVERVRYVPVPVYYTSGCGGCGSSYTYAPTYYAPARYAPVYHAPTYYAPRYHAPQYYAGCCAQPAAIPYKWAVRTARYRYAHPYHY